MKWSKENTKNLLNSPAAKKLFKITNITLYTLTALSVIGVLASLIYTLFQIQDNVYPFAVNAMRVENNTTFLFLCVFALSLLLNKKAMLIVWIVAFSLLNQIFLYIPELKEVRNIEIWLDIGDSSNSDQ